MKDCFALRRRALFALLALMLWCAGIYGTASAQADPTPDPPEVEVIETATPVSDPPVDFRFGVIESFEDPSAAGRLGAAWTRVRFQWAEVQPESADDWQPPIDDDALAVELAAGREITGLLIGLPAWARDRQGLPRGLDLPPDDPDNLWAVFVSDVVARYAGRIDRWIIWNEPDVDDRDAPGHTWDGTIEDFAQLQRVAYLSAKSVNPDASVHLGAFTYFWDPGYFDRLLDIIVADPEAPANNYYFDVATAHLYFQPNAIFNILYAFRQVLDDHGLDQPLWLVETNAPPMDDPYWKVPNWTLAVSLNEQAAFMPQAVSAALAAGAERIAVYKLKETEGDQAANPEPFGLIRWDNSRRPAFDTYRVAIRLLAGVSFAERERWDAVGQVRLDQEASSKTVLFARLPAPQRVRVKAVAGTAELVDMWGRARTIEARRGFFDIELPGALCMQTIADYCMIGGTTYYLVQRFDEDQASASTRPPLASDTPHPTQIPPPPTPPPALETTPTVELTVTVTMTPTAELAAIVEPDPVASPTLTTMPVVSMTLSPAPETNGTVAQVAEIDAAGWSGNAGLVVLGMGLALGAGLIAWFSGRRGG